MHFAQSLVTFVALATSARAGYLTASAAQAVAATDLGELESLDAFYAMLGTNFSHWDDISEYETLDEASIIDQWRNTPANTTVFDVNADLTKRSDYCQELTGFARIVCENMPERYGVWVAGGALLIYYGPTGIANWLEEVARAIRAGRDLKAAWIGDSGGGTGSPPVEDRSVAAWTATSDNTNVHFTVPALSPGMARRSVAEDGTVTDLQISNAYVYNTAARELTYDGTHASFSAGLPENATENSSHSRFAKRRTSDYTIVLRSSRQTSAITIANPGCIRQVLKRHLDDSSEHNRFGCFPLDNNGSWRAKFHVNINKGRFNYGTYGTCC